jgi:ribosome assembly protein YihI (activator of Der GTPase)
MPARPTKTQPRKQRKPLTIYDPQGTLDREVDVIAALMTSLTSRSVGEVIIVTRTQAATFALDRTMSNLMTQLGIDDVEPLLDDWRKKAKHGDH